jgi:RHS repeat-associated protein
MHISPPRVQLRHDATGAAGHPRPAATRSMSHHHGQEPHQGHGQAGGRQHQGSRRKADWEPLALLGASTLSYVHGDHLGVPVDITDASGATVNAMQADPFGQRFYTASTSAPRTSLAFPGQIIDIADRHYNLYRDDDPTLGRYLQADPIGLEGGDNVYGYVGGNPVNRIDPKGLFPIAALLPFVPEIAAGTAALIGGIALHNAINDHAATKAIALTDTQTECPADTAHPSKCRPLYDAMNNAVGWINRKERQQVSGRSELVPGHAKAIRSYAKKSSLSDHSCEGKRMPQLQP